MREPTFRGPSVTPSSFNSPVDKDRDGSRNAGLVAIQPPDAADSQQYFIEFSRRENFTLYIKVHC